jgi:RNA polymerase sigma-70 factor (ECF subfamily)
MTAGDPRGHSLGVSLAVMASERSEAVASPTFEDVYAQTFPFAWRLLRRLGVPEASLDDASQDVFVIVHRRLAEFEGRSSLRTWVAGIALRVASDLRRATRRRGETVALSSELSEQLSDVRPGPLERATNAQAFALMQRLLEGLSEEQRDVFVLAELEQLTATEISVIVGAGVNTVYSRLRLARAAFEAALEQHEKGGGR